MYSTGPSGPAEPALAIAASQQLTLRRDNYRTGASLQESADLLRLYLLTGARENVDEIVPPSRHGDGFS